MQPVSSSSQSLNCPTESPIAHVASEQHAVLTQNPKGTNFQKASLSPTLLADVARGSFTGHIRDIADRHHLLFLLRIKIMPIIRSVDKCLQKSSDDTLAWKQADFMLKNIKAYGQFLLDQGVTSDIKKWDDLPIMSKNNYVKVYPVKDTLVGGEIPTNGQCDQSSGTTGVPTTWYRNFAEVSQTGRHLRHAMKASVHGPVLSLNCFALGQWATGMTIHTSLSKGALEIPVGPDLQKAFNHIKQQNALAPDRKKPLNLVVLGYPPFLQSLSEKCFTEGLELHPNIKLWAVGGGEAMSNTRRNALLANGFQDVRSSYGASDLTINIAAQDEWDIKLEQLCTDNSKLCKAIFGRETPPSVFHYDPGSYKIEHAPFNDEQGKTVDRLLYTQLKRVTSPKMRYDLGDEGGISQQKKVETILKEHGITEMPSRTHELPLLYIYGRAENAVAFNGSKITPEHLEEALVKTTRETVSLKNHIESYALNTCESETGDSKLRILLELKEDQNKEDFDPAVIKKQLLEKMCSRNEDFHEAIRFATDKNIDVMIFNRREGPDFHPNPNTKKVYIFKGPVQLANGDKI